MPLKGIGPFATHLIVGPTCFFLGMLFHNLPYDYYILWAEPPPSPPGLITKIQYFDINETHLNFIHASPPLISRILHLVIGVGLLGFIFKLYKPSEANKLFDGASLVLYMVGITVYGSNIVKGMKTVAAGIYGDPDMLPPEGALEKSAEEAGAQYIGKEDTLRVIAASNTILALILVGILVLQGGQWYAQRKEAEEMEQIDKAREEKRKEKERTGSSGSKKKQ